MCSNTYPVIVLAGVLVELVQCSLGVQLICVRLGKCVGLQLKSVVCDNMYFDEIK